MLLFLAACCSSNFSSFLFLFRSFGSFRLLFCFAVSLSYNHNIHKYIWRHLVWAISMSERAGRACLCGGRITNLWFCCGIAKRKNVIQFEQNLWIKMLSFRPSSHIYFNFLIGLCFSFSSLPSFSSFYFAVCIAHTIVCRYFWRARARATFKSGYVNVFHSFSLFTFLYIFRRVYFFFLLLFTFVRGIR